MKKQTSTDQSNKTMKGIIGREWNLAAIAFLKKSGIDQNISAEDGFFKIRENSARIFLNTIDTHIDFKNYGRMSQDQIVNRISVVADEWLYSARDKLAFKFKINHKKTRVLDLLPLTLPDEYILFKEFDYLKIGLHKNRFNSLMRLLMGRDFNLREPDEESDWKEIFKVDNFIGDNSKWSIQALLKNEMNDNSQELDDETLFYLLIINHEKYNWAVYAHHYNLKISNSPQMPMKRMQIISDKSVGHISGSDDDDSIENTTSEDTKNKYSGVSNDKNDYTDDIELEYDSPDYYDYLYQMIFNFLDVMKKWKSQFNEEIGNLSDGIILSKWIEYTQNLTYLSIPTNSEKLKKKALTNINNLYGEYDKNIDLYSNLSYEIADPDGNKLSVKPDEGTLFEVGQLLFDMALLFKASGSSSNRRRKEVATDSKKSESQASRSQVVEWCREALFFQEVDKVKNAIKTRNEVNARKCKKLFEFIAMSTQYFDSNWEQIRRRVESGIESSWIEHNWDSLLKMIHELVVAFEEELKYSANQRNYLFRNYKRLIIEKVHGNDKSMSVRLGKSERKGVK